MGYCPNVDPNIKAKEANYKFKCPLKAGDTFRVNGKMTEGEKSRFNINFGKKQDEYWHFHFDIRFGYNNNQYAIIMNDKKIGHPWDYSKEEEIKNFNYKSKDSFDFSVKVGENSYELTSLGEPVATFKFREPLNSNITDFVWSGSAEVECFEVNQKRKGCSYVNCCLQERENKIS